MIYCEDCYWFKYSIFGGKKFGQCHHYDANIACYNTEAFVSRKFAPYALSERSVTGRCGKEGRNFVEKDKKC
jgi:hypothetical protein